MAGLNWCGSWVVLKGTEFHQGILNVFGLGEDYGFCFSVSSDVYPQVGGQTSEEFDLKSSSELCA